MKTETHEQCTVCFEILDTTDPTTITADIFDQLQLLIIKLNIKLLRNSPICDACLAKVQSACKFKTAYLDLQETFLDIKLEEDAYSEKPAVCEICKSIVSSSDTIPLFDPETKTNKLMLINHLSPELESKVNEDPQTCESCHKSMLNFCNITNLLSVFDQDICDDSDMPSTTVKKERQDVDSSLVSASSSKDISTKSSKDFCTRLKKESTSEEDDETEDKDCNEYEEFLTKNEEVDLKMDCDEEEGDERTEAQSEETEINTNLLVCNEIGKNKMFYCEICGHKTKRKCDLRQHMLIHAKPQGIEMFQCDIWEFKTKIKNKIRSHMLIHAKTDEIKMIHCQICTFKTTTQDDLNQHMLVHKSLHEVETFKCELCEFRTKYKNGLKLHIRNIHNTHNKSDDGMRFQCEICDYKARQKDNLKAHLLIHQKPHGTEMFKCESCGFKTKTKSALQLHIYKSFDEKVRFQCKLCEFGTKYRKCIKYHTNIHKKNLRKHFIPQRNTSELSANTKQTKHDGQEATLNCIKMAAKSESGMCLQIKTDEK